MIPFDFYPETEWRDDLELGATELAIATAEGHLPPGVPHRRSRYYLRLAGHWAHAYIHGPNDAADTLNLYDTSGLAHYDLIRAIRAAGDPRGLAVTPVRCSPTCAASSTGPRPRARPTRSASGSRGRSTTRRRTASAWP